MTLRAVVASLLIGSVLLASAACGASDPPETKEIVSGIPWSGAQAHSYDLVDRDQNKQGEGIISAVPDGDGWVISQQFTDGDGNADRSVVRVLASLLPVAGVREITDVDDKRREVATTSYGDLNDGSYGVRIRQQTYSPPTDTEADSTRCNPNKLPRAAYDNDTSLFLWRTITFEEGAEVTYTASIANRRADRPLTLTVRRQERVTTPAGEFDAWLVGIEGEGETQSAWFSTDPSHKLLVYDNDREIFLYTGDVAPPDITDAPKADASICE